MTRCGYPGCRCHADPAALHGPYHQWTRKKNGKTATRILSDEQLADYGPWFDNHKRLLPARTRLATASAGLGELADHTATPANMSATPSLHETRALQPADNVTWANWLGLP